MHNEDERLAAVQQMTAENASLVVAVQSQEEQQLGSCEWTASSGTAAVPFLSLPQLLQQRHTQVSDITANR